MLSIASLQRTCFDFPFRRFAIGSLEQHRNNCHCNIWHYCAHQRRTRSPEYKPLVYRGRRSCSRLRVLLWKASKTARLEVHA